MKRSEINNILMKAKRFFEEQNFRLPPWAFWGPRDWKGKSTPCRKIIDNQLGWDVTDFGSDNFEHHGLLLFTIRNGNLALCDKKPYAEKIMIVEENQETPMHFHWNKMEDIINRGGGNLVIELFESTNTEELSANPAVVEVDAIKRTIEPGTRLVLHPGESICLEQGVYHCFYGEPGKGTVLVGEVSAVNDDKSDNRFYEKVGRFPKIAEDVEPIHLLCNEYLNFV